MADTIASTRVRFPDSQSESEKPDAARQEEMEKHEDDQQCGHHRPGNSADRST